MVKNLDSLFLYIILKVGCKRVLTDLEATVTFALVQVIN